MRRRAEPRSVLDASALLAYLWREEGHEEVGRALEAGAAVSAVNLAEVYGRVVGLGEELDEVAPPLLALGVRPEPFTEADARAASGLVTATRPVGLSLGDRACLALALRLGLPALTADRAWLDLDVGAQIRPIR